MLPISWAMFVQKAFSLDAQQRNSVTTSIRERTAKLTGLYAIYEAGKADRAPRQALTEHSALGLSGAYPTQAPRGRTEDITGDSSHRPATDSPKRRWTFSLPGVPSLFGMPEGPLPASIRDFAHQWSNSMGGGPHLRGSLTDEAAEMRAQNSTRCLCL